LTASRGGLIFSCLGLLVAIILMAANEKRPRFFHMAVWGSVALAFIVALLSQKGRIGSQGLLDDARWSVYEFCIEAIRQRPLLGAGAGTFKNLFPSLRADNFSSGGVWDYAHSTILEIAVEMGIPVAVMIVLAALASLFIPARVTVKSKGRSRRLLAAITGIASAFDNRFFPADSRLSCLIRYSARLRARQSIRYAGDGRRSAIESGCFGLAVKYQR